MFLLKKKVSFLLFLTTISLPLSLFANTNNLNNDERNDIKNTEVKAKESDTNNKKEKLENIDLSKMVFDSKQEKCDFVIDRIEAIVKDAEKKNRSMFDANQIDEKFEHAKSELIKFAKINDKVCDVAFEQYAKLEKKYASTPKEMMVMKLSNLYDKGKKHIKK